MNTRNKIISGILALLVGTGAAVAGSSGGHHDHNRGWGHHRGHSVAHMIKRLGKHLDLSSEQKTSLGEIAERNRDAMRANRLQGKTLRNAAMTIDPMAADYDQRANELADQASELAREQALLVAGMYKEVAAVLTPEQREELREMMNERMERMQRRAEKKQDHS